MLGCNQTYIQPNANVVVTFSVSWENIYVRFFLVTAEQRRRPIRLKKAMVYFTSLTSPGSMLLECKLHCIPMVYYRGFQ